MNAHTFMRGVHVSNTAAAAVVLLRDVPLFCTSRDVVVVTRCCCREGLFVAARWMLWTVYDSPTRNSHLDGNQGTVLLCG